MFWRGIMFLHQIKRKFCVYRRQRPKNLPFSCTTVNLFVISFWKMEFFLVCIKFSEKCFVTCSLYDTMHKINKSFNVLKLFKKFTIQIIIETVISYRFIFNSQLFLISNYYVQFSHGRKTKRIAQFAFFRN